MNVRNHFEMLTFLSTTNSKHRVEAELQYAETKANSIFLKYREKQDLR